MATDLIEKTIGRFGKYQTAILIMVLIGRYPTEFQLSNVVFLIPSVEYTCLDENANNMTNYCPCNNPEYDTTSIISSVTSTWNLICERRSLASLAQSMLQIGILFGSLFYGYISDRFGRKIATASSMITQVVTVAVSAASTNFWMFLVLRFFIGTSVGGVMLCSYVLIIELSGKSFRPYFSGLEEISYITGYFFLGIIAYFVRTWRMLQIVISAPWIFVALYIFIIPESPRWLITVGKKQEAIDLLTKIAKWNNMPVHDIENTVNEVEKESLEENQTYGTYIDLFRTRRLRNYAIINAIIWACIANVFFGVNQYIGILQGNIYFNVMLSAAALAPGAVLVVVGALYFKRRVTIIISLLTVGISLVIFMIVPNTAQNVTLAFAIIGQIGAYTSFIQVYLYSAEIFPTVVRNSAMSFVSMFARIGGFIAPFVVNIGVEWASLTVFTGAALLAIVLCCFLPETRGTVLLNTVAQANQNDQPLKNEITTK